MEEEVGTGEGRIVLVRVLVGKHASDLTTWSLLLCVHGTTGGVKVCGETRSASL